MDVILEQSEEDIGQSQQTFIKLHIYFAVNHGYRKIIVINKVAYSARRKYN